MPVGIAVKHRDYKKFKGVSISVPANFVMYGCGFCGRPWPKGFVIEAGKRWRCQVCHGRVVGESFGLPRDVKRRDPWVA